jgi:Tfp pilus assembly protein PilX
MRLHQSTEEARRAMREEKNRPEAGFALVLAILALLLLTFLGLTLAATTSTELQIATNYRWGQQAYYNAEAGIEAGKSLMGDMEWTALEPCVRGVADCAGLARTWDPATFTSPGVRPKTPYSKDDAAGNKTRNFENGACDARGNGVGYGVVLDDGGANAPYQNVQSVLGQSLNGAFTLWIRRDLVSNDTGRFQDSSNNDALVLTAEGSAPFARGGAFTQANRAVFVMQATVSRTINSGELCGGRGGQMGRGPEGAGFGSCDPITGEGLAGVLGAAQTDEGVN